MCVSVCVSVCVLYWDIDLALGGQEQRGRALSVSQGHIEWRDRPVLSALRSKQHHEPEQRLNVFILRVPPLNVSHTVKREAKNSRLGWKVWRPWGCTRDGHWSCCEFTVKGLYSFYLVMYRAVQDINWDTHTDNLFGLWHNIYIRQIWMCIWSCTFFSSRCMNYSLRNRKCGKIRIPGSAPWCQNVMVSSFFIGSWPTHISWKSVEQFLHNSSHKQTNTADRGSLFWLGPDTWLWWTITDCLRLIAPQWGNDLTPCYSQWLWDRDLT